MKENAGKAAGKERPMLFSAPMVRALLDGSKTQTRRIVKNSMASGRSLDFQKTQAFQDQLTPYCPFGQPGDRIWVRENFRTLDTFNSDSPCGVGDLCIAAGYSKPWAPIQYEADGAQVNWQSVGTRHQKPSAGKLRPSLHMPRWASRIQMEIVSVRVERLNACSEADALAEGVKAEPCDHVRLSCEEIGCCGPMAKGMYAALWDQINGAGAWAANPWVWVVEFKRVTP